MLKVQVGDRVALDGADAEYMLGKGFDEGCSLCACLGRPRGPGPAEINELSGKILHWAALHQVNLEPSAPPEKHDRNGPEAERPFAEEMQRFWLHKGSEKEAVSFVVSIIRTESEWVIDLDAPWKAAERVGVFRLDNDTECFFFRLCIWLFQEYDCRLGILAVEDSFRDFGFEQFAVLGWGFFHRSALPDFVSGIRPRFEEGTVVAYSRKQLEGLSINARDCARAIKTAICQEPK